MSKRKEAVKKPAIEALDAGQPGKVAGGTQDTLTAAEEKRPQALHGHQPGNGSTPQRDLKKSRCG